MSEEEFLTAAEIAAKLRINQVTVIRWIKSGYLPGAIKVGKYYRIPRSSYEDFLRRRQMQPPPAE
jgi:excisionase family DNA binding protein